MRSYMGHSACEDKISVIISYINDPKVSFMCSIVAMSELLL